ncbi:MAG: nucleoside triphosphate pyrophosphohydrolase [Atopobiaceae bacterium]
MSDENTNPLDQLCAQVDQQTQERAGSPADQREFEELARTIWRLRQPDGCPWDKVQTHDSIAKNMIEEAYEAVDAIQAHDDVHLREELGDVLMQVLLHAQIADDEGSFDIHDVCRELNQKLVRRHPHVFGEPQPADAQTDDAQSDGSQPGAGDAPTASNAAQVLDIWDQVKRAERSAKGEATGGGGEPGLLDSVPISLPALMQAQKISKRAAKAGFDWQTTDDVWNKVHEEVAEFQAEPSGSQRAYEEFGDVLFSLVNVARKEQIDAEGALAFANRKFRRRWAAMEQLAKAEGTSLDQCSDQEYDQLWNRVKQQERQQAKSQREGDEGGEA